MLIQLTSKQILALDKQYLQIQGCDSARALYETGDHSASELVVMGRKAIEYLGSFVREIEGEAIGETDEMQEENKVHGAILTNGSTGDRLNYKEDPEWSRIKDLLVEREGLLKLARKAKLPFYDSDGAEVPKVGLSSPSKEILRIKF